MINTQLFTLTGLRHFRRYKLRTALTLLGVICGVATFIFGPSLANSIQSGVTNAIDDIAGKAQLEIRYGTEGFDASVLDAVQGVEGIDLAVPMVTTGGILIGQGEPLGVFGIDPTLDGTIRTYRLYSGELPSSGEVVLTQSYAEEKGYEVGQTVSLLTPGGLRPLTISGLLGAEGVALLNGGDLLFINIEDGKALRGGKLDTISLTLTGNADLNTIITTVQPLLPQGVTIDIPEARSGQMAPVTNFIGAIMYMVGGLILALSSTLIYNTMAVAVAQRRTEIGVLRAIGVTRGDIQTSFMLEAGALGLVGSIIGVGVGYLLVSFAGNLSIVPDWGDDLFMSKPTVSVPPLVPVIAFLLGTAVSTLAGYLPGRTASRVDPMEALSPQKAETGYMRLNRRRTLIAIGLFIMAVGGLLVVDLTKLSPLPVMLAYTMMGACIFALPGLFALLGRFLPMLMQNVFGIAGYLAAENITKKPGRMSATGVVVLVGIWAGVAISGSNFGYQGFANEWNTGENSWEISLVGPGQSPMKPEISLPEGIEEEVAARPEVQTVVGERIGKITYNNMDITIRALDIANFRAEGGSLLWKYGDEEAAYTRLSETERPAVILSAYLSTYSDLLIGDTLTLQTPSGLVDFEIVGTVLSAVEIGSPAESAIVMDRSLYSRLWQDTRVDRLMLKLHSGTDLQEARRDLLSTYALKGVMVIGTAEMMGALNTRLQTITTVSQILSTMLIGTMLIGIANTLFIVMLDRRREIGMLRAVGLLRSQVALSVVLEVVLMVLITALLAVPLGMFNNWINTFAMENFIGIRFDLFPTEVAITLAIITLVGAGAAFFPARYAGRVDVLDALRYE